VRVGFSRRQLLTDATNRVPPATTCSSIQFSTRASDIIIFILIQLLSVYASWKPTTEPVGYSSWSNPSVSKFTKCIHFIIIPFSAFLLPLLQVVSNSGQPPRARTMIGRRSFAVAGPSLWNSLPAALRRPEMTLHTLKQQLKAVPHLMC